MRIELLIIAFQPNLGKTSLIIYILFLNEEAQFSNIIYISSLAKFFNASKIDLMISP